MGLNKFKRTIFLLSCISNKQVVNFKWLFTIPLEKFGFWLQNFIHYVRIELKNFGYKYI